MAKTKIPRDATLAAVLQTQDGPVGVVLEQTPKDKQRNCVCLRLVPAKGGRPPEGPYLATVQADASPDGTNHGRIYLELDAVPDSGYVLESKELDQDGDPFIHVQHEGTDGPIDLDTLGSLDALDDG